MAVSPSWARAILDFIESKQSIKILICVFLISTSALIAPETWTNAISMTVWVDRAWPWLMLTSSFSGLMLLVSGVEHFGGPVLKQRKARRKIEAYLETLSVDEIGIPQQYADSGRKTVRFHPANGAVQNLVNMGILYWSGNLVSRLTGWDCTVMPMAEPYLRREKFQEILNKVTKRDQEARQASMDGQSS